MGKESCIIENGEVIESLKNATFRVELDNGHVVMCVISGKIRKNNVRVLVGDRVEIEISPYDLSRGRISRRHKLPKVNQIEES